MMDPYLARTARTCIDVKGGEKPDQRAEQNTATAAVGVRWSGGVGMRPRAVSAGNYGRATPSLRFRLAPTR